MMMMILLLVLVTLPSIFLYLLRKTRNPRKAVTPPGPSPLPLIGNLHQIGTTSDIHVQLWKLANEYGPIMRLKLGSVPTIVISSAKLAKEVMKTQDLAFCSRPGFQIPQRRLTYNFNDLVFSPYGDYWREMKKIAAVHLFSLKKTQSFRPVREDEVSHVVKKISGFASDGKAINLSKMAMALGSSMVCRVAFGKRYDDKELRRFDELLQETQFLFGTAFFMSEYFPGLGWVDKVTGLTGRLERTVGKLDSFYQELIDEHLDPTRAKRMEEDENDDILDILIRIKEQQSFTSVDLSWDHIKALLTDIFIAGTDTSAATTIWIMTMLMKSPDIMKKVQSEVRALVGKKGKVDEDDLPKLPYLKAAISEAFRLYPPVPLIPRETIEKCIVEGYEIQSKTTVYINVWAIGRDPEYWENPQEFLPERFLNSDIDIKGQDFGVIPFGSGRRMCPGMSMGVANVELTIANLLYAFEWELPKGVRAEDIDTDVLPGLTMHKKNALVLVPRRYEF